MIRIKTFVFNAFQENTFLLHDDSNECIVIDPGMNSTKEQEVIISYIEQEQLIPVAIVNTHCHVDHLLGAAFLKKKYNIPFYIHKNESDLLNGAVEHGKIFGFDVEAPPSPDKYLNDQEIFEFGKSSLKVLLVPGHSPGGLCLYSKDDKFVITGDALFNGSIGRTDLPGGDYETLLSSIRAQLLTLPGDVAAYPGHGPATSIGKEHDTNPFLN